MSERVSRRHFLRASLGAVGAAALAACVPAPAPAPEKGTPAPAEERHEIAFAWWTGGEGANKVFEEAIDRFELSHPNYKVNRIAVPVLP